MNGYVIIALIAAGLLMAEAILPTGGLLGAIGVLGFFAAGIIGLSEGGTAAEVIGAALIAVGIGSALVLYVVVRKVYAAHRGQPPKAGPEQLIGGTAEARTAIAPNGKGQAFTQGAIWSAVLADGSERVEAGAKVTVEAVDGLTLVVRPQPQPVQVSEGSG